MSERSFELLIWPTEWIGSFVNSEASIICCDVRISSGAILSVDDSVGSDVIAISFRNAQTVKRSWMSSNVCRGRLHLMRRLVRDSETTIVHSDVSISVVATHAETLLESVALVDQGRLKVW